MLAPSFGEPAPGLTEENLQARIRGTLLMALSNKFGWLVLTTGNKSEMAVGYATLYGDMAGGFAVIKDVPKTLVYDLCRDRNERAGRRDHPEAVIDQAAVGRAATRPDRHRQPSSLRGARSASSRPTSRTTAPQAELDRARRGIDEALVRRVVRLVDVTEYKRRQAPPGVRVTTKAFGKDRRLPITNRYRG